MRISPSQLKAARNLVDLTAVQLSELAKVSRDTIADWEAGRITPHAATVDAVRAVLDARGVEFIGERGVTLREECIRRFRGPRALAEFLDDVYATVMQGGELCVTGVDENLFDEHYKSSGSQHSERMKALGDKISMRCILRDGDANFAYNSYISYRWMTRAQFDPSPLYVYNHKLALINFSKDDADIIVIEAPAMAHAVRKQFDFIWQHCKTPPRRKS